MEVSVKRVFRERKCQVRSLSDHPEELIDDQASRRISLCDLPMELIDQIVKILSRRDINAFFRLRLQCKLLRDVVDHVATTDKIVARKLCINILPKSILLDATSTIKWDLINWCDVWKTSLHLNQATLPTSDAMVLSGTVVRTSHLRDFITKNGKSKDDSIICVHPKDEYLSDYYGGVIVCCKASGNCLFLGLEDGRLLCTYGESTISAFYEENYLPITELEMWNTSCQYNPLVFDDVPYYLEHDTVVLSTPDSVKVLYLLNVLDLKQGLGVKAEKILSFSPNINAARVLLNAFRDILVVHPSNSVPMIFCYNSNKLSKTELNTLQTSIVADIWSESKDYLVVARIMYEDSDNDIAIRRSRLFYGELLLSLTDESTLRAEVLTDMEHIVKTLLPMERLSVKVTAFTFAYGMLLLGTEFGDVYAYEATEARDVARLDLKKWTWRANIQEEMEHQFDEELLENFIISDLDCLRAAGSSELHVLITTKYAVFKLSLCN